jgi:hypothetical protein
VVGQAVSQGQNGLIGLLFIDEEHDRLVEIVLSNDGGDHSDAFVKPYATNAVGYWTKWAKLSGRHISNPMEILAWMAKDQ